jgi:LacI family transcriptional regulator
MSERARQRVTQVDVARAAGVSQATVSYVLNGNVATVPEQTRRKVLEAMKALGYVPNAVARNLRLNRTETLATVIPDITNPFYPAFQRGVQDVVHDEAYDLVLLNTDGDADAEDHATTWLRRGRVDGAVVVLMSMDFAEFESALDPNLPVVQLVPSREAAESLTGDAVFVDNAAAQQALVEHLLSRGHRRIAMIAGSPDSPTSRNRVQGYRAALEASGLDASLVVDGNFSEEAGYRAMTQLMAATEPPTAVVAVNDLVAIGALQAARTLGLGVPGDVAVCGFDDIPEARVVSPALTTIDHDARQIGRTAGRMLLHRLSVPDADRQVLEAPTRVLVRESA